MKGQSLHMISKASVNDWKQVDQLVDIINLDRSDMHPEQFRICKAGSKVLGIGRIKRHNDCLELCTLGVDEGFRGQGIGKALVLALLEPEKEPVYVVTDIPEYFEKLGFVPGNESIQSLQDKKKACVELLACKQPFIMVHY
jgi:N-acetylglutamate synthase-like GNAT family acetyltransferase